MKKNQIRRKQKSSVNWHLLLIALVVSLILHLIFLNEGMYKDTEVKEERQIQLKGEEK